jgi:hypothetical protein
MIEVGIVMAGPCYDLLFRAASTGAGELAGIGPRPGSASGRDPRQRRDVTRVGDKISDPYRMAQEFGTGRVAALYWRPSGNRPAEW